MARPVVLSSLDEKVRPDRTALLVIDMLNDFVHPDGKTAVRGNRPLDYVAAIVPTIRDLLYAARQFGILPIYVVHSTLEDNASDSGPWLDARSRATYSVEDIALEGTWGQRVVDGLTPEPGDIAIRKHRYSGFAGTNLDMVLRSHRRETVVCTGASTNVCVEATAREAFSHEYYVVLASDACASWSVELHQSALATAAHRYAAVCEAADLIRIWNAGSK